MERVVRGPTALTPASFKSLCDISSHPKEVLFDNVHTTRSGADSWKDAETGVGSIGNESWASDAF